ncbi:DUF4199 domain-containing protein [Gelatiniphilus marinus]|uniref:DUF4199 domain-containing protein n=1 Tax=Gelatiniphilus marinus TaxID=1759464 RepID=A0ABW5JUI0_9FLAO
MEKSIKSVATNYGLYLGTALSLLTVLGYANLDLFTKWWFGIGTLILIIIFGITSSMKSRSALNGYLSFKEAFTSYFIAVALGLAISTLVSILIFNFIDPDAAIALKEKIIDSTVQMMQNFGAPEGAIAETVEKMEADESMFAIGKVLQSLAFQLIGYSVVGLIVALVVKKNKPVTE